MVTNSFHLKGELDDIVFRLAAINHFGKYIQSVAEHVDKVIIPEQYEPNSVKLSVRFLHRFAQVLSFMLMFLCWVVALYYQRNGDLLKERYPNCNLDTFEERLMISNGLCESKFNTPACGFDGGDC